MQARKLDFGLTSVSLVPRTEGPDAPESPEQPTKPYNLRKEAIRVSLTQAESWLRKVSSELTKLDSPYPTASAAEQARQSRNTTSAIQKLQLTLSSLGSSLATVLASQSTER